jgi:hypothetical protein
MTTTEAKKAANVAAAAERLTRLQSIQRRANQARAMGYLGDDKTVIDQMERGLELARAKAWVEATMSGPHGPRIKQWARGSLAGDPCKVAQVVGTFLKVQGLA